MTLAQENAGAASFSRTFYVRSRTARSAALRLAYLAYARTLSGELPQARPEAQASLRARIEELFGRDFDDAQAGLYPKRLIETLPWKEYAQAAPRLIRDLPRTRARIREGRHDDLPPSAARYPRYYARNFHYQSEGYLGETSARLYDLQVELLFGGTADAMRRRALSPVIREARGRPAAASPVRLLDVACGTGHSLGMLGAALPEAHLTGVDLSPHYLARARETLPRELHLSLVCENAEALPFQDGWFDATSSTFLFHELPGPVRDRVLSEMARVTRKGGLVVVADSIQLADAPELESELLGFSTRFHEPFYPHYVREDLAARVAAAGLSVEATLPAFLTKVIVARKPA